MEAAEPRFEVRLTTIGPKVGCLERGQQEPNQRTEKLSNQITDLDKKVTRLEKAFELLGVHFKQMEDGSEDVQIVVENVDNRLCKNNLRHRVLKEGAEGGNLKV